MSSMPKARKTRIGTVVSKKVDNTAVVVTETLKKHPFYGKYVKSRARFMAHDPKNECAANDKVEIVETRPISKRKNWMIKSVLEKAK